MRKFEKHWICQVLILLVIIDHTMSQERLAPSNAPVTDPSRQTLSFLRNPFPIDNKIVIQWKYAGTRLPEFFVIERSTDERHFKTIAVIRPKEALRIYEFADEGATGSQSFYRVKGEASGEPAIFSAVIGAESMVISCKIYPNPVDHILIIRSEIAGIIQVKDQRNNCRLTLNLEKGLQSIDVSAFEKGLYVVTLYDKVTNKIFRQRIIKH